MPSVLKIFISRILITSLALSLLGSLLGCASTRIPGIYRMDVRQGNYICEETICRLKKGMSKTQVQELFGSPAISHVLNKDRWDYYYSFEPGIERGAEAIERRLSIYFKHDRVIRWE